MHTEFWSENLKGRDHWEDLCVDGRCVLKEMGSEDVGQIHLVLDTDQWRELVNMVMKHLQAEKLFASEELFFMESVLLQCCYFNRNCGSVSSAKGCSLRISVPQLQKSNILQPLLQSCTQSH